MKYFLPFLFTLCTTTAWSQDLYLVNLKPKTNTSVFFNNPLSMLSQKALDRRINRDILLDEKDVPILPTQIQEIKNLNLDYVGASKWLNTIMVEISDETVVNLLQNLPFVDNVESLVRNTNPKRENPIVTNKFNRIQEFDYGYSTEFINQLNLKPLHDAGFTGQNILIGVIDAGFPGVNTVGTFKKLRDESRIIDTYNFVNNYSNVYQKDSHGTMVLANMAGNVDGTYVGSAPDANYALYISEDANPETPKELLYWIQAAERADSVGVDIINTSLGYTTFDDSRYDFTYEDMNGETTLISKGAKIAASRGIFVVNAMGNDGDNSWHYISAPADVPEVFSIGANDSYNYPASFTSYGPNAVGIYKPNVSAMGVYVPTVSPNGNYVSVNGTSFASPIMAGSIATLMSAYPTKSINELKNLIENSAHLYPVYSNQLGYGIPNFETIFNTLNTRDLSSVSYEIFPNPTKSYVRINSKGEVYKLELFNMEGKILKVVNNNNEINIQEFPKGIYMLNIYFRNGETKSNKIIIQ